MSRKQRIFIGLLLGLLLAGGLLFRHFSLRKTEGERRLREALMRIHENQGDQAALQAVRQMGTNILPQLMQMIRARDSKFTEWKTELNNRQTLIGFDVEPAEFEQGLAVYGFQALGSIAAPAIPDLLKMKSKANWPPAEMFALVSIGEPAVPIIATLATNTDAQVRRNAFLALADEAGALGATGKQFVPLLLTALRDEDWRVRLSATSALGSIHAELSTVVPALITLLKDDEPNVRGHAAQVLAWCGKDAVVALAPVSQLTNDPNARVRSQAAYAVQSIEYIRDHSP